MTKIFGIPAGGLTVVLAIVLALALAVVLALAVRNRVFFRLGVRNLKRRRGRTVLIVTGLMLGTTIISAALATGDTMSNTIRSVATGALGQTDEIVAAKGVDAALASGNSGTGGDYFPQRDAVRIAHGLARSDAIDGVAPVITEPVAVQDVESRQTEPRVTLFAAAPAAMRGFGEIRAGGEAVSLRDLGPGEIYVNAAGADKLHARAGDVVQLLSGTTVSTMRVKAIVRYDGGGTDGAGVLMPLRAAQQLLGKPRLVKAVFVSNAGGVAATDEVMPLLRAQAAPLGLEVDNTKQDALEQADAAGAAFMSFFTTFGSFSIAAGILLIFLIFVMLAAERRGELGIARAVGTRRGHLVQLFLFEGLAYDLLAALVGVALGIGVAYGMVLAMAAAFSATEDDLNIVYAVKPTTFVLGYAIGVLLTLVVVAFSARRVSRMNIVAAIRDLPEPPEEKRRRLRWLRGGLLVLVGAGLAVVGVSAKDAVVLGLGVSLVILSLVPILELAGVNPRAVRTGAGLALVLWFVLPISRWLFGELKVNFSIFLLGGLMIVLGASWTLMYNADLLLGALASTGGRIRALAPVLRMAIAYPLRSLFRTGVTLAMFTLVVFTLVVGATTSGAFTNAFNDLETFGGGFDIRATSSPAQPIVNMPAAVARTPGLSRKDFSVISSESTLPVKARQLGVGAKEESYVVNGADDAFLSHTTYGLAARGRGFGSTAAVWRALRTHPNYAVVDQFVVPRKANWGFGLVPKFQLQGFYLEDEVFDPVRVTVRDQQTGKRLTLTVIGVLADSSPEFMSGIWTSQRSLQAAFGERVLPTIHLFALNPGVDPKATAQRLESAFLPNGMQADALKDVLADLVGANVTMNRLVMGFMALGLVVGVAALGVITARAVVERRQQIGVLRAIGFRKGMVQLAFLLESSFVALTSIAVGTFLGLVVAHNVISDSANTQSWQNLSFDVPWANLGIIFLAVYLVAVATTWLPALRASRTYPAEALRYQ
jgi:putative ABC transport system permease protein